MQNFPTNLLEATRYFADDQRCIDTVASLRWPDGKIECPKCGAKEGERKHYWFANQKRWKCYACRKQFSVKVNSIFEDSAISLDKWLVALWMLCNCKNGISSYEIARDLKVTQKSAWFVLQRLRTILPTESNSKFGSDGGPVESDEAWVGPNPRKMHKDKRARAHAGGRYCNKTAIHGLLDRELRQIRATVVPNVRRETLQNAILENVSPSAKIYTDEATAYIGLDQKFVHEVVDHSRQYVRGEVHTNSLENFWSLLKRALRGTYVAVEPFHLDKYLAEQIFRYNNRTTKDNPLTDADRFALAVSQISDKRLTFAELTGKVPPSH